MFPFTIQIKKKINFLPEDKKKLQEEIKQIILENDGKIRKITESSVTFSTKFIKWNWELFFLIDKGIFSTMDDKLIFKFYLYKLFVASTFISLLIFNATKNQNPYVGLFAFLFLCVGNWVFAIIRGYRALNLVASNLSL